MWVIVFVLTLVVSMGGAYAYFTATAEKRQASATTGIIKVGFSNDTKLVETSTGSSSNIKIVPGSTVNYNGHVQNTGTADMYALLECNVRVDDKIVQTQYYTATGEKMAYSDSQKNFTTEATPIAVGAQSQFSISFTFDKNYGNEYKGKSAKLQVVAHAIQQSHLTALQATNQLLSDVAPVDSLPSNYTELKYIEATGSQWFATDFAVDSSTDNFIVETSIKWTQSGTRQLMGYSGSSSGYFGVRADMKYELAGNVSGNISASTTSFDSIKVIRNKTSNIWSMYVNNSLAGKSSIDAVSGKMTVGSLYQSETTYKCYCQIRYFKIYQDGALKYNLIPSQNSAGAVGMYDTVNNKFYTSTSGTAFVAGAPAEPT